MAQFKLPTLPYAQDSLKKLSQETFDFHYSKHHKAYIDKMNELIQGTPFAEASLEDIVRKSEGPLFNNAAQAWNHTFYWFGFSPKGGGEPQGALKTAIEKSFGSFADFKTKFNQSAIGLFGSGWLWLVKKSDGGLELIPMSNAGNPIKDGKAPILTCDVWEHAYYIDYRNARAKYLEEFWNLVDWQWVSKNFESTEVLNLTPSMRA